MPRFFRVRCHIVRCVRYGLLLCGTVITVMAVWNFLVNGGEPSEALEQTGFSDKKANAVEDNAIDQFKVQPRKPDFPSRHDRSFNVDKLKDQLPKSIDMQKQTLLDYIAKHLGVRYDVVANEGGQYHVDITLTNSGTSPIERCCFSIFFAHMKSVDTYAFNAGVVMPVRSQRSFVSKTQVPSFSLSHVNGYTFQLQPTKHFAGLQPEESVKLRMTGGGWSVSRGEVLPNWYVAGDSETTEPRIIQSTADENLSFVGGFNTVENSIRGENDFYRPFVPEERFRRNRVVSLTSKSINRIIPTPLLVQQSQQKNSVFIDIIRWKVVYNKHLEKEAVYLKDTLRLKSIHGGDERECREKSILLTTSADGVELPEDMDATNYIIDEAYTLRVLPELDCIMITGVKPAGVFNGAVSLISLIQGLTIENGEVESGYTVDEIALVDAPRFEYRGVMIDVARNFHTVQELFKLIDAMALYKLNKLHLHLSDDEGWRLEIPSLGELVEVGSRRGHDLKERNHLISMLGTGPFTNSSGSGHYSVAEYRSILRHALSRHVEVVPEFDMPSHSHAAIKSMESRFRRLQMTKDKDAGSFLLSDLEDESVYLTGQFFRDSAINPCIESSYRFVEAVMEAVIIMHRDIMPLRRWHFGGDEVPQDAFSASPACYSFMQNHARFRSTKDLKTYFVRRVVAIAARHGLSVHGWDDAFTTHDGGPIPRNELKNNLQVVSQAYYNTWESGAASKAYDYANNGYKVVLSSLTALYFDNPQEPDPEDWGLHWATRFVDTRRAFRFAPDSIYDSIDEDFWGRPTSKKELCDTHRINCIPLERRENILGMEAAMWSELIRTPSRMDAMLWPRMLALAERSWHKAPWEETNRDVQSSINETALAEDWSRFASAVGHKELRRLEDQGVDYYLPRPGAKARGRRVYVNTAFPGLIVQISFDSGRTWQDFTSGDIAEGHVLLATRSHDGRRRSVPIKFTV